MNASQILFDLDGTLTDPLVGITRSVQYALKKMNIVEDHAAKLKAFIGPPLQQSFAQYYGFSIEDSWKAVDYYRQYFQETGIYENEVYPGIVPLLEQLQVQGRTLYIATSKPTLFAEQIAAHFNITPYFQGIYGSELDGTRSDKAELIPYIIKENGIDHADAIMIGDRKHDIIGAKASGISSIGVGYGYGSENELIDAGTSLYCRTVEELVKALLS